MPASGLAKIIFNGMRMCMQKLEIKLEIYAQTQPPRESAKSLYAPPRDTVHLMTSKKWFTGFTGTPSLLWYVVRYVSHDLQGRFG